MSGSGVRKPIVDFDVLAAAGQIRGVENKAQVGFNTSVGSTLEDIWPGADISPILQTLSAAETMDVVSTSGDDDIAGTGARTVTIKGLDNDFLEIEENLNLTGLTIAVTQNEYIRLESCRVIDAGTGGENAGDITLTATTAATLQAFVSQGFNNDQQVQYTVPANKFAVFTQFLMETQKDQQGFISLWIRNFGEVYALGRNWNVYQSSLTSPIVPPLALGPKADITMRGVKVTAGDIEVACNMNFYLVNLSLVFT